MSLHQQIHFELPYTTILRFQKELSNRAMLYCRRLTFKFKVAGLFINFVVANRACVFEQYSNSKALLHRAREVYFARVIKMFG